jgi:peptidoglycan/xylan/chitin deacetylase (PgdA/CDA1 family)
MTAGLFMWWLNQAGWVWFEVILRATVPDPFYGDIILFHDDGECALHALEILLPEWKRAGLRFLPLDCAA